MVEKLFNEIFLCNLLVSLFLATIFGLLPLKCLWIPLVRPLSDVFPSHRSLDGLSGLRSLGFLFHNSHPSPWEASHQVWVHGNQESECTTFCQAPT